MFLRYRRVRRTTLISFGCVAFLAGLGLAKVGWWLPLMAALVSLVLLLLCRKKLAVPAIGAVLVIGGTFGLWRGGMVQQQLQGYRAFTDQKVTVTGTLVQDSTYGTKRQIDFMVNNVTLNGRSVPGQVRVTTFDPLEPKQGDVIEATGKLKSGFGSYQAGVYFAKVQILEKGSSWVVQLRRTFSAAILNVLPEPQASLGLGFLLGIKSQLPDTLNDQLKIVDLTHIVVASGYNLTILVRAARRALAKRSKYQATLAAVLLMVGFVAVTGLSPSMSRAALVTSLALAAWYYGRTIHPVVLLLFSAAVTAAVNPLYVWGDIGWYLSFLAFGGVMLGAPLLQERLFGNKQSAQLVQIGLETLCAELFALPLVLFVFGTVSVVAFPANILVVPLIPLAMLATFMAGLAALLGPGPLAWLALPAQWVLTYMTGVVEWLASIPWAQLPMSFSAVGMVLFYTLVLAAGWLLYKKIRYNYLGKSVIE